MFKNQKEKINLFFLAMLLILFILTILYNSYKSEYKVFENTESSILTRYEKIDEDINNIILDFNFYNANINKIKLIDDDDVEKNDNGTFSYNSETKDEFMYFVGEYEESGLTQSQIYDMNSVLKLIDIFRDTKNEKSDFKYIIYISENNFTSMYPYNENGIDTVYFRYILNSISKTYSGDFDYYYQKGFSNNSMSSVFYIDEYDEYLELINVDYSYEALGNVNSGKLYLVYDFDPVEYLSEDKYKNYYVYTGLDTLTNENRVPELSNLEDMFDDSTIQLIKDSIGYMTENNLKDEIFESNLYYYKIRTLDTSNNIVISQVNKLELFFNALYSARFYLLSLFIGIIGFLIFLKEVDAVGKLEILVNSLAKTNKKLSETDKFDYTTGLLNRRGILEYLNEIQKMFYVIIISIDKAKYINELYGYDIGDKLIVEVADSLSEYFDDKHKICKWSGKDFLVIYYPKINENVKDVCYGFSENLDSLIVQDNLKRKVNFTVSIGISKKDYYNNPNSAIKEAEDAIEYAKEIGDKVIINYEEIN